MTPRPQGRDDEAGRVIDAGLHLLDRQIVDVHGCLAGKVDDLELTEDPDGGPPTVTAILSGPGALFGQFHSRVGRWLSVAHRRLAGDQVGRIGFGVVSNIEDHVDVSVARTELAGHWSEDWLRRNVVDRIPGARRAPE